MGPVFQLLSTPRLLLREITAGDAPALFAIHSDVEVMRWFGADPLKKPAQADQLAAQFASAFTAGTGLRWAIVQQANQQLVGTCGVFRWNQTWRSCLLGFELARSMHRRGYMGEALSAVLLYAFDRMHLHRIQAESHARNHASIALLTRLGFQHEGIHRQQGFWSGQFHDLNCYALLRPEWRAEKYSPA